MKYLLKILAVFFLSLFIISCTKSDPPAPAANTTVTFKAVINGVNETTPNTSTANGEGTLLFNTSTKIFTLTVTHTLASPMGGHIHRAAAGANGPVIFPFTSLVSPIVYTSVALDAMQEADLNANLYYINLHTSAFPGGEIRGQIIKQL